MRAHTEEEQYIFGVLWSLDKTDRDYLQVLYSDFIHHGLDRGILSGDPSFPELAIMHYPHLSGLFERIGTPRISLRSCELGVRVLDREVAVELCETGGCKQDYVNDSIHEVSEDIIRDAGILGVNVRKSGIVPVSYSDLADNCCPIELAFSLWHAVLESPLSGSQVHEWWSRFLEILSIPSPSFPPLVNLIYSSEIKRFFEPSRLFEIWMFKMHLKKLFLYIYWHLLLLQGALRSPNPIESLNLRQSDHLLSDMVFRDFRIFALSERTVQVIFKPFPSWKQILSEEMLPKKCHLYVQTHHAESVFRRYLMLSKLENLAECVYQEGELREDRNTGWQWHVRREGLYL